MSLLSRLFGAPDLQTYMTMLDEEVARHGEGSLEVDRQALCLRLGTREVPLERPFEEFSRAPARKRPDLLRHLVESLLEDFVPRSFDRARPRLVPRMRDRAALGLRELESRLPEGGDPPLPHLGLTDGLAVALGYDTPTSLLSVDSECFAAWEVTLDEAVAAATENLRQFGPPAFQAAAPGEGEGRLLRSAFQDAHDAARLLLWKDFPDPGLRGRIVAAAPAAPMLLLAGSEDRAGLDQMAAALERALALPEALGPALLVLGPEGWETFEPTPSEAGPSENLCRVRRRGRNAAYAEQKALLDRLSAGRFDAPYVAAHNVHLDQQKGIERSFSVWTQGMETLLPRVDEVHFVTGTSMESARPVEQAVPWERLQRVAGHLLTREEGLLPPRYRVEAFPSEEEMARLLQA